MVLNITSQVINGVLSAPHQPSFMFCWYFPCMQNVVSLKHNTPNFVLHWCLLTETHIFTKGCSLAFCLHNWFFSWHITYANCKKISHSENQFEVNSEVTEQTYLWPLWLSNCQKYLTAISKHIQFIVFNQHIQKICRLLHFEYARVSSLRLNTKFLKL